MKKILLYLFLFVVLTCQGQPTVVAPENNIYVDPLLKESYSRFVKLMKDNDIPINYYNIKIIETIPLAATVGGLYSTNTKNIYINIFYQLPAEVPIEKKEYFSKELIFMLLAHEIGHSQGLEHKDYYTKELMSKGDYYWILLINEKGADQTVLDAFCSLL